MDVDDDNVGETGAAGQRHQFLVGVEMAVARQRLGEAV